MSSNFLSALDGYVNDVNLEYNPESYKEPKDNFRLLPPGNYRIVIDEVKPALDKQGKPVLQRDNNTGNPTWPILTITKATIQAPDSQKGRVIYPYYDVRTKPFMRDGVPASELIDWLRAYDATVQVGKLEELLAELNAFVEQGRAINVRIDWQGYDRAYIDAIRAQGQEPTNEDYNKARVRRRAFDEYGNGVGPSGEPVKARLVIDRWFSSLQDVAFREAA